MIETHENRKIWIENKNTISRFTLIFETKAISKCPKRTKRILLRILFRCFNFYIEIALVSQIEVNLTKCWDGITFCFLFPDFPKSLSKKWRRHTRSFGPTHESFRTCNQRCFIAWLFEGKDTKPRSPIESQPSTTHFMLWAYFFFVTDILSVSVTFVLIFEEVTEKYRK